VPYPEGYGPVDEGAKQKMIRALVRDKKFWVPFGLSIPIGLFASSFAFHATDFGFGTFRPLKGLFPYNFVWFVLFHRIPPKLTIALYLGEFVAYGLIVGVAMSRRRHIWILALLILHLVAVLVAFGVTEPRWQR